MLPVIAVAQESSPKATKAQKKADAKKAMTKAVELGGDSGVGKAAKRALESL